MNNDIIRKMPFSMIAEQALLGAVLLDPESIRNVADTLSDSDFYVAEHQQIFAAMLRLFSTSNQIDVVTLIDDLVRDGVYDKSGGESYIRTLTDSVPSALNIRDYAKIVKEKSLLRRLIEAGEDIAERAYSEQDDVGDLLDYAGNKIYSIAQGRDAALAALIRSWCRFTSIFTRFRPTRRHRRAQRPDFPTLMWCWRAWVTPTLYLSVDVPAWERPALP